MRPKIALAAALFASLLSLAGAKPASACAIFGRRETVQARTPSLLRERTLIIFDQASAREHFVREARFSTGSGDFGFVVPVPTLPEVAAVQDAPFTRLDAEYPVGHVSGRDERARARSAAGARKGGASTTIEIVNVLESKRVGDFQSYVLAATDQNALAAWLAERGFGASAAGTQWIARYVRERFYFVALKYVGSDQGLVSRSLRISFDSALPYYPYREPDDVAERDKRELEVWLVSSAILLPLANSGRAIARPWSEGTRHRTRYELIANAVGPDLAKLLPEDPSLQVFADWKRGRRGWGDVVLAPEQAQACDAACVERRRGLLDLLDPATEPRPQIAAAELAVPAPLARVAVSKRSPASAAPAERSRGCQCANAAHGGWIGAVILCSSLAVLAARRRRRLAFAVLIGSSSSVGCRARPAPTALEASAPDAVAAPGGVAYELSSDPIARRKSLMRLLAGNYDDGVPRVDATPLGVGLGLGDSGLEPCLPGVALEARVSWTLERDSPAGVHVLASGPVPAAVLDCVERVKATASFEGSATLTSAGRPEQKLMLDLLRETMWSEHYQVIRSEKPRPRPHCNCDPGDPLCSCY